MMSWAHRFIPAARSSLILLAMNIVAIAAAWPIHDEPVTLVQAAGGIVVLLAVAAVLSRPASVRLVPVRTLTDRMTRDGDDRATRGPGAGRPPLGVPPAGPAGRDPRRGRTACATAGVSGVLVPQIFAPPWAALGAAAACDEDIELASGIAMAFVRSPLETAMAALDLDRLSGGRFTLGLGSSVRAWNVERFGVDYDRPVARLRELVGLLKRMVTLDEQPRIGRFEGEFWHVDLDGIRLPRPIRPTLPITLAPLRAAMTEMAAEVADGILGHPVWSRALDRRRGAGGRRSRAGPRRAPSAATSASRRGCASPSPTTSSRVATTPGSGIPFYASLRQYDSYFDALGLAADARRLQDLAEAGAPPAEQSAAISDAMVDELVMIGPPRRRGGTDRGRARRRRRRLHHRAERAAARSARASTTTAIAAHLLPGGAAR